MSCHLTFAIWLTSTLQGFIPLPKSVTHIRIEQNADVYDFELTAEEMKSLETNEVS